jgi:hypothetical protein
VPTWPSSPIARAIDREHLQRGFRREQRGIAARILPQAGHQPRRRHQVVPIAAIGAQRKIDALLPPFREQPARGRLIAALERGFGAMDDMGAALRTRATSLSSMCTMWTSAR